MSRIIATLLLVWALALPSGAQERSALARVDVGNSGVTDLRRDAVELRLDLSQGVPYRVYTLTSPARLVVDFREVDWQGVTEAALLREAQGIDGLRFGGFRPGWSRLVADLPGPRKLLSAGLSVDDLSGRAVLSIVLGKTDAITFAAASGAPRDPRWDLPEPARVNPPQVTADGFRELVVVIDPGHGGIDPGAQVDGASEADLMMALARETREALLRAGGFQVMMTRQADEFVSLERRVAIAHQAGGDLFISLHADSLAEGNARGATVYTLSESASDKASAALAERHDRDDLLAGLDLTGTDDVVANVLMDIARQDTGPRSRDLALALIGAIENAVGEVNSRPLRQAGFSVLKAADIPSVLIEAGFLSTGDDLKNLKDPIWRAGMAAGIRDGVQAWAKSDAVAAQLRRK